MPEDRSAREGPVQPYLDYLDVECGLARNTLEAYRRDLAALVDHLAPPGATAAEVSMGLLRATRDDLKGFLARRRQDGASVKTVRRLISAVRGFYKFLAAEGQATRNPAEDLTLPKDWERLPEVLSVDEIDQLGRAIQPETSRTPLRDRAILELLYGCGLRVSELCNLQRPDLRLEDGFLRCRGKGNKERLVPIGDTARRALERYLGRERPTSAGAVGSDVALVSVRGRRLGRETIFRLLRKYSALAGLGRRVSPHTLRHSYATHLLRGGAGLREVQELLGHADIRTTEIYTHVDRQELKDLHRKHHPRG